MCYFEPNNFVNAQKNRSVHADPCAANQQRTSSTSDQMFLDLDQIQQQLESPLCSLQPETSMQDKMISNPSFNPIM